VNLELPGTVVDFADAVERALADAGGTVLCRQAEERPATRAALVEPLLARLGVDDLDPRHDVEAVLCAAELCRLSGRVALPYPVESLLACPAANGARLAALVDPAGPWIEHADLAGPWLGVDIEGMAYPAKPVAVERNRTLAPFVQRVRLGEPVAEVAPPDRALLMDLSSCRVLGVLERALEMAVAHVKDRHQFGRPLAALQAVQFHLVDGEVAVRGLRQLVRFTLWRLVAEPAAAMTDALALRSFALESARTVLAASELLHGALAFCDEHDLTLLTRSVQAPLRLPFDLERTTELLVEAIDQGGFDGLFNHATERAAVGR
jgi:hypothetical protein